MNRRDTLKIFGALLPLSMLKDEPKDTEPTIMSMSGRPTSGVVASDALAITINGQEYHVLMVKKP